MTTNLDVLYRFEQRPGEAVVIALAKVHEVYGVRRIVVDEQQRTIRVGFDFTRLSREGIAELLRSAGLGIVEEISLVPPQPAPAPAVSAPATAPALAK